MQCAVCDAAIDEFSVMCPYCGHVSATPYASTSPLIATRDLPIIYPDPDDDQITFPFEQDQVRHAGLRKLLLFLIAAEMLIACIGLMTLPSTNATHKAPTNSGQVPIHHSGVAFERIVFASPPDPRLLPTAPVVAIAPAVVVTPRTRPHRVSPTRPPARPTATPTFAPSPTSLPTATAMPVPPTTLPLPTPTAMPPSVATPTPTIPVTPPPTIAPTPSSTPGPVTPSPSPPPLTPVPTVTR